jgi:hypothetical protein
VSARREQRDEEDDPMKHGVTHARASRKENVSFGETVPVREGCDVLRAPGRPQGVPQHNHRLLTVNMHALSRLGQCGTLAGTK